jgi:O-6-methylguanine DNA methyltransferase
METFKAKVLKIVKGIKRGEVLSYKEVARRAGRPRAYRAVGNILSKNFNLEIPCHRVVRSDGRIGGYNRGARDKEKLLETEGSVKQKHGKTERHSKI